MIEKVIETSYGTDVEGFYKYMFKTTNVERCKIIFSIFPKKVDGKWIWFKLIKAIERKYYIYKEILNEWDYKFYWKFCGIGWKKVRYELI